jgi:hypothetical protein
VSATVKIEVEKLKMLFDLIVQSMDFGSGFLDHEDVTLLREIAVIIGVDPMEGTPSEMVARIVHPFKRRDYPAGYHFDPSRYYEWCRWCGKRHDDPIHARDGVAVQEHTEEG